MKIRNMITPNNNTAPNQFIITTNDGEIFQSYKSVIAIKHFDGHVVLDKTYWNYSSTTGKYRNMFLGEDRATTEAKIASGEYQLTNLNPYGDN